MGWARFRRSGGPGRTHRVRASGAGRCRSLLPYYTSLVTVSVTPRIVEALDRTRGTGVLVLHDLDPRSPAAGSGLRVYDVIVEIEETPIETREDHVARTHDYRPGDTVRVQVVRNGETKELELPIGRRDNQ
ncbi:MAG: hypothetical protein BRD35_06520 [Bacteroidetes bacterium QH_7_62_13]|nr:MAG: hypothetical protein BRD35_06520 [Bacteroidetes bacterium QH_7_62_13]